MYVSPRFRDIFSSGPIATRRGDATNKAARREVLSDAEFARRSGELQVDLIWLEIAQAHRKGIQAFAPEIVRAGDFVAEE